MAEAKLSERAQKILSWLQQNSHPEIAIRQQSLAEQFNCSRRTIGRVLKELKEAGLLLDLNKRHENRCKLYELVIPGLPAGRSLGEGETRDLWIPLQTRNDELTPQAQLQWEKFEKTFRIVFREPDLKQHYHGVTWGLSHVTEEMELWCQTWAKLRVIYGHPSLI
jgi:hypothetical protein